MKTIKITNEYFIRVTNQNYTVCKLIKKEDKSKEVFMYPSYHTSFLAAIENIQQRMIREAVQSKEVQNLKEAVDAIHNVNESLKELISNDLKETIQENYDMVSLDEETEETEDNEETMGGKSLYV